nr:hypothetical protein [uncultured Rhodoferax sp.]
MSIGDVTEQAAKAAESASVTSTVFRSLHGYYGVLFTSKFATGILSAEGKDQGILSARKVWAYELSRYEVHTIANAVESCKAMHPEFPPSLPQFVALCAANAPRKTYKPAIPEIEMSQALRSQYARQARETNARHHARAVDTKTGFTDLPISLDGLKQAVAQAVGLAGGDEVHTLLRLDRQFSPRVHA